jgi:uncharacterized protein YdhG (YjbR/CyaY superfamily)
VITQATDVAAYMDQIPSERQAVLKKVRALCRKTLKGYEECMEYGLPCYKRDGKAEVGFASQKNYIALYVMKKEVVDEHRATLAGASVGKGCIRFSRPEKIDFDVVASLLKAMVASKSEPC